MGTPIGGFPGRDGVNIKAFLSEYRRSIACPSPIAFLDYLRITQKQLGGGSAAMAAGLAFVTDEATDVKNVEPALSLNYIPCQGILFCLSRFSSEGFHVIWCQLTDTSDF